MSQRPSLGKRELVETLANEAELTAMSAERAVNALLDLIGNSLASGKAVSLGSFGTFEPRHRNARQGRNPKTGETIEIAAKTVAAFKPGAALKRQMEASDA